MTTREAENKSIVRRFYAAFEADDVTTLNELLAPDLVAYSNAAPGPQSREVHLQGIRGWNAAFGESHFTIEEQIAEGDKVASRVTLRATHSRGVFQGLPPTGKQVVGPAVTIERIKDGKIVERRVTSDWFDMMRQLGLIPAPQPPR